MMKKNEIKIGMQVIFDIAYVGATCGTVLAVEADRVKIRDDYGCEIHCRLDDVYANEKDYEKKSRNIINNYKKSIKDVNDLVKFMYNNRVAVSEEYTDWEARTAVKERAKELLNIDL